MTTYGAYELTYLFRVQIPSSLPFGPKGLFLVNVNINISNYI